MNYLKHLLNQEKLNRQEATDCMHAIMHGVLNDEQIIALISLIQYRGIELSELQGFRDALLELAVPVKLDAPNAIDLCGTGGDGKNTFNISTATSFVLAGMGYQVIKHGNHGVSSYCGSSTIMEQMGYRFTADTGQLQRQLDEVNICLLHAPLFHPALKQLAGKRKNLGIPTFFNSLGPLVNPVQPAYQLTGTYSLELAHMYQHILSETRTNFMVLHGLEGFDELTFIGATRVLGKDTDRFLDSAPNNHRVIQKEILSGNDLKETARNFMRILSGKGNQSQHTVLAGNAALAIQTIKPEADFQTLFETAYEFVLSGKAIQTLQKTCV